MAGSGYVLSQDPISGLSKNSPQKIGTNIGGKSLRAPTLNKFNAR